MKKLKKGSALTTVILVMFVMVIIGAAVMNLVVYNYKLRQLDLTIKKSEYKSEIIMDKIYEICQNSIITAVGLAKTQAIEAVDKAVDEEKVLYEEYENERIRLTDEWTNGLEIVYATNEEYQQALETYINNNLPEEYKNLTLYYLSGGQPNQYRIQLEYSTVFQELYKYILDRNQTININEKVRKYLVLTDIDNSNSLIEGITTAERYTDVITNVNQNIFFNADSDFNQRIKQSIAEDVAHIKPALSYSSTLNALILSNEIFYKVKGTPTVTLSADFILSLPEFNNVSAIEQHAIEFSNPLVGNKAIIAGGNLNIESGSNVTINGDAIALKGINGTNMTLTSKGTNRTNMTTSTGKLITAGDITLTKSNLNTDTLYYQNLFLKGTEQSNVNFGGDVYARDDLEIETSKFNISQSEGNYYGFNDVNDKGPDSSSSIIINSSSVDTNSTIELNNLYLAGRAFIENVVNTEKPDEIYKTGESISVKGNYVAYQTPISNSSSSYSLGKVNYASYLYDSSKMLKLVNSFVGQSNESQLSDFDVNYKWKYFVDFAKYSLTSLKIPKITINTVKYMQGAGVGRIGTTGEYGVISARIIASTGDPAFKTNCSNEYDLQTKYFGYSSEKTEIFGANGWLNTLTSTSNFDNQPILIYDGDLSLTGAEIGTYKIVICSGDIDIETVSGVEFHGVIIAGGDINIKGTVNFNSSKSMVMSEILEGANIDSEAVNKCLYNLFKYDNSGTIYVITIAGDSYIDMNNLIGITNWKKKDWGYL